MRIIERIKNIFTADSAVAQSQGKSYTQTQYIISLVVASAFFVLTLFNIFTQSSKGMLLMTGSASVLLYLLSFLSWKFGNINIIKISELSVCAVLFTVFTVIEGNEGFAALWLIIAPYIMMTAVDIKMGFFTGMYFFVMLAAIFWTPLKDVIGFSLYSKTFMIRFPVLYFISLIFATIAGVKIKLSQYAQLLQSNELKKYQANLEDEVQKLFIERDAAEKLAYYDEMTGLYNRVYLQELIENGEYSGYASCGIAFFDINNLKKANDSYGHTTGDLIITTVADSLKAVSNQRSKIFRLGGDEFLMIVSDCGEHEMSLIIDHWRVILDEYNHDLIINCSVACGYACGKCDSSIDELIKQADKNMYANKRSIKSLEDKNGFLG